MKFRKKTFFICIFIIVIFVGGYVLVVNKEKNNTYTYTSTSLHLDPTGKKSIVKKLNAFLKRNKNKKIKIILKNGIYKADGNIVLQSNVNIVGEKKTVIRAGAEGSAVIYPSLRSGYSGGIKNVYWKNIHFSGGKLHSFETQMVHAKNVKYSNCYFRLTQPSLGHIFDIDGSSEISFLNCIFRGRGQKVVSKNSYKEAIQLDYAYLDGLSLRKYCKGLDGLPTKDIMVKRCKFLPIKENGNIKSYAVLPIGSHSQFQNRSIKNIVFEDNEVIDPLKPVDGGKATLHFLGTSDVIIKNNKIQYDANTAPNNAIKFETQQFSFNLDKNTNPSGWGKANLITNNVSILENTISGGIPKDSVIDFEDETNSLMKQIHIKNNVLISENENINSYTFSKVPQNITFRSKNNKIIIYSY